MVSGELLSLLVGWTGGFDGGVGFFLRDCGGRQKNASWSSRSQYFSTTDFDFGLWCVCVREHATSVRWDVAMDAVWDRITDWEGDRHIVIRTRGPLMGFTRRIIHLGYPRTSSAPPTSTKLSSSGSPSGGHPGFYLTITHLVIHTVLHVIKNSGSNMTRVVKK